ncbi:hypothetical protein HDU97_008715 [Phlyctochytrium planicorne]|nr:hypothetical protein HDU97_008715 [Phlyctochytrium planicorne]
MTRSIRAYWPLVLVALIKESQATVNFARGSPSINPDLLVNDNSSSYHSSSYHLDNRSRSRGDKYLFCFAPSCRLVLNRGGNNFHCANDLSCGYIFGRSHEQCGSHFNYRCRLFLYNLFCPRNYHHCGSPEWFYSTFQTCSQGTVCCPETNACDNPYSCPSIPKPVDACALKNDNDIICTSPTAFKICAGHTIGPFAAQECNQGTVCCETLNRCDYASVCKAASTLTIGSPSGTSVASAPASTTESQSGVFNPTCVNTTPGTSNIVCTTSKTFAFCLNGAFVKDSEQSCPTGTVCCPNTNLCDWAFNCPSQRPPTSSVNPVAVYTSSPGAPVPTIAPATCDGKQTGVICKSATTFNFCVSGGEVSVKEQTCPVGTVCCAVTNTCDWPFNCPPAVVLPPATTAPAPTSGSSPSPSPSPVSPGGVYPSPSPSPKPAATFVPGTYGSCANTTGVDITCASASQYTYCYNGVPLDTGLQTCPSGTVCCGSKRQCIGKDQCADTLPSTTAIYGVPPPPSATTVYDRSCSTIRNGFKCTSATTFNICNEGLLSSPIDQKCSASTICCPTLSTCSFSYQCPLPSSSTYLNAPPPSSFRGSGVVGDSCDGVADGSILCSTVNNREYNYCENGALYFPSSALCPVDTVCCPYTNACEWKWNCKPPVEAPPPSSDRTSRSCVGVELGGTTCVSDTEFIYCNRNNPFLPIIKSTCPTNSVCCPSKGVCTSLNECSGFVPSPPSPSPSPPAISPSPSPYGGNSPSPSPYSPSPSPLPSSTTTGDLPNCLEADASKLYCFNATHYNLCVGKGIYAQGLCPLGLNCCSKSNSCDWPTSC